MAADGWTAWLSLPGPLQNTAPGGTLPGLAPAGGRPAAAKPVLVTGGAGFIGSHTAAALLARGDRVVVLDRDLAGRGVKAENLEAVTRAVRSAGQLEVVDVDLADPAGAARALSGLAAAKVIHLAAKTGVAESLADPLGFVDVNLRGSELLLQHARESGATAFLYASSGGVYGGVSGGVNGDRALQSAALAEDDPADRQRSVYSWSKRSLELLAEVHRSLHGLQTVGLRYFSVYGPRGRRDMVRPRPFRFLPPC